MSYMPDSFDDPVLAEWQRQAQAGDFPTADAAAWYGRVQEMRERADYYERGLIRHLKWTVGLTWQQVAEVVNANLSSRQAAYVKWKRLVDDERRTSGSPGRGGWQKGRPRQ